MDHMRDFRKLDVWRRSHELTLAVYRDTKSFPASERFGLTSQLRRAAASVPANIAGGAGRDSKREYAHFLNQALGSTNELEYHLLLAYDLGLLDKPTYGARLADVEEIRSKMTRLRQVVVSRQ